MLFNIALVVNGPTGQPNCFAAYLRYAIDDTVAGVTKYCDSKPLPRVGTDLAAGDASCVSSSPCVELCE